MNNRSTQLNDRESELTDELVRAQHKMAEMYRKNQALDAQRHELTLRLNELVHGQSYSISGKSALVNDHAIDLHIQETLRLRRKRPIRVLKALLLALKIRHLRLFDFQWYLDRYPDIRQTGIRPFKHFLMHGIFEGRDPSPRFNTRIYLGECLHIMSPGEPAFLHYLKWGRSAGIPTSSGAVYPGTRFIAARLSAIEDQMVAAKDQLAEHNRSLEEALRRLSNQASVKSTLIKKLIDLVNATERSIKESSANDADQLGKLIGIQNYLIHGEHPLPFRKEQISPDLGLLLIDLLSKNRYDLIVEFGSGTSTVLMAKLVASLPNADAQTSGNGSLQIIAFEHLPSLQEKTMFQLEKQRLQHIAQVHLAPFENYREGSGTGSSYYDCQKVLSEASAKLNLRENHRILVLVDGPSEGTNLMAKLPALDVLKVHFPMACIELVLNGYRRPNELAIVETWARECARSGIPFSSEEVQTEKGCAIFRYRG